MKGRMIDKFLIDPKELGPQLQAIAQPMGFVTKGLHGPVKLPYFPLIGLKSTESERLDSVIEQPISSDMVRRQILVNPHAAAVAVQVLRATEKLDAEAALIVESAGYAMLQGSAEFQRWLAARGPVEMQPSGRLRVERDGTRLDLTIDRPWARNAIDRALRDALHEALTLAAIDPDITSITLKGAGKVFSIGGELAEFGTTADPASAHIIRALTLPAHALVPIAHKLHVHVQGACIGAGLEMAAFAHRFTATSKAWFQLPELSMGLIPGAGGMFSVPRRIGRQRTALMILSGKRISAEIALRWGLIDSIVD